MNRQIRLAARPTGAIKDSDWEHHEAELPQPGDGEFLARTRFISLDPAMRGWLDDRPSYIPPVGIGEVMRAGTVVEVIESRSDRYAAGDLLVGSFGVQEYVVSDGRGARKLDGSLDVSPSIYLGALGMPGLTAYFGLYEVGALKDGETVVVSGAAGAVGTVVGQLAKRRGCRVVGIAGGPEKCAMVVDELGFDACVDYRSDDVRRVLREHCPAGIDVYFDNVGGEILDAALANLARGARVVICGAISQYNADPTDPPTGPANYLALLVRSARMEGFVVFDFADRYAEAFPVLEAAVADGSLKIKEHVVQGEIDDFPQTLQMLFDGKNTGKLVLEL
ncbi:MAG: NADP-dependent oxidoreductase [Baekduia sp.]